MNNFQPLATKRRTEQLAELLLWNDAEGRVALEAWIKDAPPDEANDRLTALTWQGSIGPKTNAALVVAAICFWLISMILPVALPSPFPLSPIFNLFMGIGLIITLFVLAVGMVAIALPENRKIRIIASRAAVFLGRRGDERAIAPLVTLWRKNSARRSALLPIDEEIEATLANLLEQTVAQRKEIGYDSLPHMAAVVLKPFLTSLLFSRGSKNQPDLTDRQTDMGVAALLLMNRYSSDQDYVFLRRIAQMPGNVPNRTTLREVASLLLNPNQKPVIASLATTPITLAAPPMAQQNGRKTSS